MRLNKLLLLLLFAAVACKSKAPAPPVAINQQLMLPKLGDKPAIFFSCIRCGCMVTELNKIYRSNPQFFDRFTFFADTSCVKEIVFKKMLIHSPQTFLDSVYDENYSVMVFKKTGTTVDTRLI